MSPENERFLKQLVEHGRFPNVEAALDAAVGFARREYERDIAKLREEVQRGLDDIEAGRVKPLDIPKLKEQLRREFLERSTTHAADQPVAQSVEEGRPCGASFL